MPHNKEQLFNDLRQIGIRNRDVLLVHASLSKIGQVEGGADTVVDALLQAVGPYGTLLMPSFQGGAEFDILSQQKTFDLRSIPSDLGIISETFRKRPGVLRSTNPTHAVSGIGPFASTILADHERCNVSTGHGSPFEKLAEHHGKILLLGVDHSTNTCLHYVENTNGAPTLSSKEFSVEVIDMFGNKHAVKTYSHMPAGMKRNYPLVEPLLIGAGNQNTSSIGSAPSKLVNAGAMFELIGQKIQEDPLFLIEPFKPESVFEESL